MVACKPTEKNYADAYGKAYEAAQRRAQAENESSTGEKMERLGGPRVEVVNGDTVLVAPGLVRPTEPTDTLEKGRVGIAVAHYKMSTNANRHADDLKGEYPASFVAADGDNNYYVMIKRVTSIPESVDPIRIFMETHPDYRYIGLGDRPQVVFISPR